MKKVSSVQRYQTEKGIINALLKISEIIKKTTNTKQYSKKTTGDGDKKQQRNEYDYDVPIPPSMRTLESYVSGFNQQYALSSSSQRPLNCNQAPILLWNSGPYDKQYYSARKKRRISNDYRDRESAHKHHRYDISSLSDNHHREKSSRSNKRRRIKCECQTSYDDNEYSASDC